MPLGRKCPRCGEALLWNGQGMSCIACSYLSGKLKSPSEKAIPAVKPRRKENDKK